MMWENSGRDIVRVMITDMSNNGKVVRKMINKHGRSKVNEKTHLMWKKYI